MTNYKTLAETLRQTVDKKRVGSHESYQAREKAEKEKAEMSRLKEQRKEANQIWKLLLRDIKKYAKDGRDWARYNHMDKEIIGMLEKSAQEEGFKTDVGQRQESDRDPDGSTWYTTHSILITW